MSSNATGTIIKKSNPSLEQAQAGVYDLVQFEIPVTAAANATAVSFRAPFGFKLVDAYAIGGATSSGATFTLRSGTTALSSAMTGAADKALGRTTTLDAKIVKAGDVLNVIANGANDRGVVYIVGRRT
jgi:hypothetical protein